MKIITLEEHYQFAEIQHVVAKYLPDQPAFHQAAYDPPRSHLEDLGEGRIQRMDAMGIDVQVLSNTSAMLPALPAAEAVPLARDMNDRLAAAIAVHPDRFAGFAALPTPDPEAAADELERAVRTLGLKGALISGRTNGRFLDDPAFRPILAAAEALDVPLYLHPAVPPKAVVEACYADLDPAISLSFATAGWGWHLETGTHALHMILAGVFDRYPGLQLILGHWGEMIPFYLARFSEALHPVTKHLQRPVADYFLQQMYVTPSGMFTLPQFLLTLHVMGAERNMYSVDYPYIESEHARTFLEQAPISPADKAKIAHENAERVLKLTPM